MQCLLFEIDGAMFAMPTAQIEEVVPLVRPMPLPDAPDWVPGVIDHRGRLLPLLDLPRMIGASTTEPTAGTRIVIADVRLDRAGTGSDEERRRIAVLVGPVHEVVELDPAAADGFDGLPGGSMPHLGRLVPWSSEAGSSGGAAETTAVRLVELDRLLGDEHRDVLFGNKRPGGSA